MLSLTASIDDGLRTQVTDQIEFEPRFSKRITERAIRALFVHRISG